jgi:hypothetical protein
MDATMARDPALTRKALRNNFDREMCLAPRCNAAGMFHMSSMMMGVIGNDELSWGQSLCQLVSHLVFHAHQIIPCSLMKIFSDLRRTCCKSHTVDVNLPTYSTLARLWALHILRAAASAPKV